MGSRFMSRATPGRLYSGESLEKSIEDPVKLPFSQKVCIRPKWSEVQKRSGKLDWPDWWNITFDLAKRYQSDALSP